MGTGGGFVLLTLPAFLPSVISSFVTQNKAPQAPPLDSPLFTLLLLVFRGGDHLRNLGFRRASKVKISYKKEGGYYSRTPLIRTRLFRIPRYFELKTISLGFAL